jgi:hypothetical protein
MTSYELRVVKRKKQEKKNKNKSNLIVQMCLSRDGS